MPIFIAALVGGFISAAASMAGRVLIAIGFGIVAYTGISTLLDTLKAQAISNLNSVPSDIIGIMGLMKVDVSLSIIFSAIATRLLIMGLTSGVIKKMVLK
jgi:hypothetical protein